MVRNQGGQNLSVLIRDSNESNSHEMGLKLAVGARGVGPNYFRCGFDRGAKRRGSEIDFEDAFSNWRLLTADKGSTKADILYLPTNKFPGC